jgi:hypothetical protein
MSKEKFEHKDELDCEVTVFEGAHSTCEKSENKSSRKQAVKREKISGKEDIKDNYMI